MTKTKLGVKRVDPETGKKFYDLGRDPVVSPYTGKSYPLSYFATSVISKPLDDDAESVDELDAILDEPDFVPLENVVEDGGDTIDIPDLDDAAVALEEDDVFLSDEDDDIDGDMQDLIGTPLDEDEEDI